MAAAQIQARAREEYGQRIRRLRGLRDRECALALHHQTQGAALVMAGSPIPEWLPRAERGARAAAAAHDQEITGLRAFSYFVFSTAFPEEEHDPAPE